VDALVHHAHQALGRAHALFGGPSRAGAAARNAGSSLTGAGHRLGSTRRQMTGLAGVLATHYTEFADDTVQALDTATGTDTRLAAQVRDAGSADHAGWANTAAVVNRAQTDTAALTPRSSTPAGQRALIATLRARLAQQQHIVTAYQARDARLAAALRSLAYRGAGRSGSGAMRLRALPFGDTPGGGGSAPSRLGGVGPLATQARSPAPKAFAAARGPMSTPVVGTPLGALTPDSSPREVAAAIIHEAQRRGYSPYQTTAILADAIQESDLSARAVSLNRLWVSIFQQDASYPDRDNPNLAIAEFFNRLGRHGGPSSPDIWKSIFWLQQRPGEPSAEAAYAHGRQAYLREIQGQYRRAVAMYRGIIG
jgi:hypothetical protein